MDFNSGPYSMNHILGLELDHHVGKHPSRLPKRISAGIPELMERFLGSRDVGEAYGRFYAD